MSVSAVSAQLDRTFNLNFELDSLENTQTETTTPIPILRYVDTQNPDGSYTFGYESGDGTYKIETRWAIDLYLFYEKIFCNIFTIFK